MKKDRLEDLRRDYESIPIPEELELRVRASIEQAKQAQKKEQKTHMKKHNFWKATGLTAAAAMLTLVVLANSTAGIAHALEQVPILGAITRVVTFRTFEEDNGNTAAKVEVPHVDGGTLELNETLQAYADAAVKQYEADAEQAGEGHYRLDLSYSVVTDSDALFSLRFDKTVTMASGTGSVMIYNVDKATGKVLPLSGLFQSDSDYLTAISESIKKQMRAQMEADENVAYWLDDPLVEEANFQSVSEDTAFYVDKDGQLVIVFNQGDVAPAYMGVVEFTIPTEALTDMALPGYLR